MEAEKQSKEFISRISSSRSSGGNISFVDNRPQAASQAKLIDSIQRRENRTGLPDDLKTGMENLSGFSMDDVRVHYNSSKPAQLNALAYMQGTDIHVGSGEEKYLPHEAWHVIQQKQGRVQPSMQMQGVNINNNEGLEKEADVMGEVALSSVNDKNNEILKAAPSLKSVLQRHIIVSEKEVDKELILDEIVVNIKGCIHGWLTRNGMTAMLKRNKNLKDEITATKSSVKASQYLDGELKDKTLSLLAKYDTENRTFKNRNHLESQLIQDVKLGILGLDDIVGIDHHIGQFSQTDKSGADKPLRIYRTTPRDDWNTYLRSKSIAGLLHGHGGSLGQALDYFYKSKNSDSNGPLYDNVIFELTFIKSASKAIDYDQISSGAEGGGPKGEKLTGKKEQNDILGENNVFSVNLTACRDLILVMKPTIRRVDEIKGEDSQYSKRLVELGVKHGEYPPQNLTEAEIGELDMLIKLLE